MRVLYFTRDYTPHDYRFLKALADTPHEVFFLRLERRGHVLEHRALPAKIEHVLWDGGNSPVRMGDGFKLLSGLKNVIRKICPDIIHAGPIQTAAFLTALSGFRKLVSMSWGYDLMHDVNRGRAWQWSTRYTLTRSSAFVGDCETIKNLAVNYGMDANRIVIFPWGVDLEHFQPAEGYARHEIPMRSFVVLSTRSWEPIYGVEVLAEAFIIAANSHPELQLVMTGNGSLAGKLKGIFQRAGVLDRVTFPGHIHQAELPSYYRKSDLYVSASHSDGSSISMLEALACGLPVLVSDIPGNQEWVQQGEQGWTFPDGDAQALAKSILDAVENREKLAGMGKNARILAEKRADWNKNFPKLLQAYSMAYAS